MHHYPLHRNVEASCTCCRIKRDFTFKSPTDHVVCPGCARHQGNSPNQESLRNRDHADLFRSEFMLAQEERKSDAARHHRALEAAKAVTAQRDEVIAEKNATIGDLRATIQTGDMNPMVETWLAEEAVKQAHEQRDSAYRSRSYAYESLWRLSRIHREHDTELDLCACGRKSDKCKELLAIREALPAVKHWENAELRRLHENLNHGLPPDHPEVLRLSPYRRRWG
jgi:hypothetical protein